MKNKFGLLMGLCTTIGAAIGIAIENIPAALSMGLIIGFISGMFTKIISNN